MIAIWVLVGILVTSNDVSATPLGTFTKMDDCFRAREYIWNDLQRKGIDTDNKQVICVKSKLSGV